MRVQMILSLLFLLMVLTACAELKTGSNVTRDGFVEVVNPAVTMSPGAPATIWVPRESVETGVPRGSALAQAGYDSVVSSIKNLPKLVPSQTAPTPMTDTYR